MKKNKVGVNIIDIIIIIIIIGVVIGAAMRFDLMQRAGIGSRSFELTVLVSHIQEASEDYINVGDIVFLRQTGAILGRITEIVDVRPGVQYVEMIEGHISRTELPDRIDVIFKIEAEGIKTDDGHLVNGIYFVSAGREMSVYTTDISIMITTLSVR